MMPITVPTRMPARGATEPTKSETRAPQMTRERTSRPKASVPNRCAADGGSSFISTSWSSGSNGAIQGAQIAISTIAMTSTIPITRPPERVARFQADGAAMATGAAGGLAARPLWRSPPAGQQAVGQVGQDVGDDDRERGHDHEALQ